MKRYDFERQVNQDLFYHILGDVIADKLNETIDKLNEVLNDKN